MNIDFGLTKQKKEEPTPTPVQPAVTSFSFGAPSIPISVSGTGPVVEMQPAVRREDAGDILPPAVVQNLTVEGHISQPDTMVTTQVEEFKKNAQLLYMKFTNRDMIQVVMKRILVDLDEHPELREFLAPEDVGMMIRLLRENYGMAVEAKKAKVAKSGGRKKKEDFDLGDLNEFVIE